MKESTRIAKLMSDHFNGDPWIDVNIMNTLQGISAKEAAQKPNGLNSIWMIVNHLAAWRKTLLKRINDEKQPAPADNYFKEISTVTDKAWTASLKRLQATQEELMAYLTIEQKINFDEKPSSGIYSRYELLQGVLQHDAYHLGQIVLIKKMIRP